MKISIIMPMYNDALYLKETILSIMKQSYKNWELIIIDDVSTDESYEIAKEMSKKDKRIKVYENKKNLGISGNRNKGLSLAKGDYIAFCDDDDIYLDDYLMDCAKIIEENPGISMIKFGRRLISVNSLNEEFAKKDTKFDIEGEVTEEEKYEKYFLIRKSDALFNLWNGIYQKKMLDENNIIFDEEMKYGGEDADFSYQCYLASQKIYIQPKTYYVHYKRDVSSTSRKYNMNKVDSVLKAMKREFKIWDRIDFNNLDNQYYRIIALNINIDNIMFSQVFHKDSKLKYAERKRIYQRIKEETLNLRYILNKKILKKLFKENKKHFFISLVIATKKYFIIDIFYQFIAVFKRLSWK